jgi:hypothetical protein
MIDYLHIASVVMFFLTSHFFRQIFVTLWQAVTITYAVPAIHLIVIWIVDMDKQHRYSIRCWQVRWGMRLHFWPSQSLQDTWPLSWYSSLQVLVQSQRSRNDTCHVRSLKHVFVRVLQISWFQTFAAFWMLYAFFWAIPRCLNLIYRRFGTLCSILIGG